MAYRNVVSGKKGKPPGGVKRAVTAPQGKADIINTARPPNPRAATPPGVRTATPAAPRALPSGDPYANLKEVDPAFADARRAALESVMPGGGAPPDVPAGPEMSAGMGGDIGTPAGVAAGGLPRWAIAKGVTPDQYESFLQRNPNAPGNALRAGGRTMGGDSPMPLTDFKTGDPMNPIARRPYTPGDPDIMRATGGRTMGGGPMPLPGQPQAVTGGGLQAPPAIEGAGPNVQALARRGFDPALIQQRMRLRQKGASPTIVPPGPM